MKFRTYHEVTGGDRSDLPGQIELQQDRLARRLAPVRRVLAVMSGKGGVGKTWIATGVAASLAGRGHRIGLLDADLAAPTAARSLEAAGPLVVDRDGVHPARGRQGVLVCSTDLLLDEGAPLRWREPDEARFVWRGALEAGALREFLADVVWGELDLLVVDLPPGIDRLQDLAELVPGLDGLLPVSIPTEESRRAVHRAMRAARDAGLPLLGLVENMSGYRCPGCSRLHPLFPGDCGSLAEEFGIPLLARVPFAPGLAPEAVLQDLADRLVGATP